MLRHVLMFRIKDHPQDSDKLTALLQLKKALEGLKGQIPELLKVETGINTSPSPQSYDLFYSSEFDDAEALERYRIHPEHQRVVELIKKICADRVVVDYMVL